MVKNSKLHMYCLVQYKFNDAKEHPMLPCPDKSPHNLLKAYVRMWKSTKLLIQNAAKDMRQQEIVYKTLANVQMLKSWSTSKMETTSEGSCKKKWQEFTRKKKYLK